MNNNMLQVALKNPRTTLLGLSMIIGATVKLVFACKHGTADEDLWTASLMAIATGLGFLLSGDGAFSLKAHAASTAAIEDLKVKLDAAVKNGDTTFLQKPGEPPITPKV